MSAEAIHMMEDQVLRDTESEVQRRLQLSRLARSFIHDDAFLETLEREGHPDQGRPAAEVLAPYIID